jgi:hypothetical protein
VIRTWTGVNGGDPLGADLAGAGIGREDLLASASAGVAHETVKRIS